MAVDVAPPTAPENKAVAAVRGIPSFYQAVLAEMKKVTWPDIGQVRQLSIGVIVLALFIGAVIWLLDVVLQQLLVKLIPSLFSGR